VGLRLWTVVLKEPSEVAEVLGRVESAGIGHEDRDGGFVVRDPWNNAVAFQPG
jgi:hypothetical protein